LDDFLLIKNFIGHNNRQEWLFRVVLPDFTFFGNAIIPACTDYYFFQLIHLHVYRF